MLIKKVLNVTGLLALVAGFSTIGAYPLVSVQNKLEKSVKISLYPKKDGGTPTTFEVAPGKNSGSKRFNAERLAGIKWDYQGQTKTYTGSCLNRFSQFVIKEIDGAVYLYPKGIAKEGGKNARKNPDFWCGIPPKLPDYTEPFI